MRKKVSISVVRDGQWEEVMYSEIKEEIDKVEDILEVKWIRRHGYLQCSRGSRVRRYEVHCLSCRWSGRRSHGALKRCPECQGVVVWTFTERTKVK